MKNTYFVALKSGNEPVIFAIKPYNCVLSKMDTFQHAYIMESKEKAEKVRRDWYRMREERKNDEKYPDFF